MNINNGQQVLCFLLRIPSKKDLPRTPGSLRIVRSDKK